MSTTEYPITQNFIPGLPQNPFASGVGAYDYVVAHSTANNGDTALGERNYESNTWNSAFVQFFVDYTQILQVASTQYLAWGAGPVANPHAIHVELCQVLNDGTADAKAKFLASYDRFTYVLAYLLFQRKLGVYDAKTLYSHAEVAKLLGGTDHTDPCGADGKSGYLGTWGVTWAQVVVDVTSKYVSMQPQQTYVDKTLTVTATSGLHIRADYSSSAAVVDTLANGQVIHVDAYIEAEGHGWYHTTYGTQGGWVWAQYVQDSLPKTIPTPVTPAPVAPLTPAYRVSGSDGTKTTLLLGALFGIAVTADGQAEFHRLADEVRKVCGQIQVPVDYKMAPADADKLASLFGAGYNLCTNQADKDEFHRLANEFRKASGQTVQ